MQQALHPNDPLVSFAPTCVWMGLKWEKRYMASKGGQPRADLGRGSKSSSSVWGGWRSGSTRPLKLMACVDSAPSQSSDTALQAG